MPGGSTHTIDSTSTLTISHNSRLDKTQGVPQTSRPFSTTGTDMTLAPTVDYDPSFAPGQSTAVHVDEVSTSVGLVPSDSRPSSWFPTYIP